jgi:hypothetical protein
MNRKLQNHLATILLHSTAFDAAQFEALTITEASSTERIPIDEGEYPAVIDDYAFRPTQGKDGKSYLFFDILWNIDDPGQREKLRREKVIARQSMSLERSPQGGLLSGEGVNVEFGRVREAVGLNKNGQPFQFSMLKGQPAKVKVKHRTFTNAAGEEEISAEVRAVTPL